MKTTHSLATFRKANAIEIQQEHLADWEAVLKPEIFSKLKALVEKDNSTINDPYEICRGDTIYEIVTNELMPKHWIKNKD